MIKKGKNVLLEVKKDEDGKNEGNQRYCVTEQVNVEAVVLLAERVLQARI